MKKILIKKIIKQYSSQAFDANLTTHRAVITPTREMKIYKTALRTHLSPSHRRII